MKQNSDTYSVYNESAGQYDYYQTHTFGDVPAAGYFRKPRSLGPEGLCVPLPSSAQYMGSGRWPRGFVAYIPSSRTAFLGQRVASIGGVDIGVPTSPVGWALLAGGAYLLWRFRR